MSGIPFEKGKSGNPSGRPKGSTNRIRFEVAEICKNNNCDPFEVLAKIANGTIEKGDDGRGVTIRLRMEAAAELGSYLSPKLKAVELTSDPENPVQVSIHLGEG